MRVGSVEGKIRCGSGVLRGKCKNSVRVGSVEGKFGAALESGGEN